MWREGSVCEPLSVPKRSAEDRPPQKPPPRLQPGALGLARLAPVLPLAPSPAGWALAVGKVTAGADSSTREDTPLLMAGLVHSSVIYLKNKSAVNWLARR